MAPASNDPISATSTDIPLCTICPSPATLTCSGCANIHYCSLFCQNRDWRQHCTVCDTFQNFLYRPTDQHYRAIYFPPDEELPQFIWLLHDGDRGHHSINKDDMHQYVPGQQYVGTPITAHHGITPPRQYDQSILVERVSKYNACRELQGPNRCLQIMMRPKAKRMLGGWVAHAFKYRDNGGEEVWDKEDRELGSGRVRIALDLDTSSLRPMLVYLAGMADAGSWCTDGFLLVE